MSDEDFLFQAVDYVTFIAMLCISVGIGLYYGCTGRKQKTILEYLMGNKKMGIFPIAMSAVASSLSSLLMVGMALEVYVYGIHVLYWYLGFLLALPATVYIFIPVFYNLQLVSVYEYVELRFNRKLRYVAATSYTISMTFYGALVLYGLAICLRQVTGMNIWWSTTIFGIATTFYTAIGGIKAVIWADVIQGLLMLVTTVTICVKGTLDVGGIAVVLERNAVGGRFDSLSFSLDPRIRYTFWSCTLAPFISNLAANTINQMQVQRWLSTPTMKHAQKSVWCNLPIAAILMSLNCYVGLVIYAKYWQCDPLTSKKLGAPDQLVPFFVMKSTFDYSGLAGLFVAGVASASLSTFSSIINSLAAIVLEDFVYMSNWGKSLKEEGAATISKVIAASFGILCVVLANLGDYFGSIVQSLGYNVYTLAAATLGIFCLGLFSPWTTSLGTSIGAACGLALGLWLSIGSQLTRYIHPRLPVSVDGCLSSNVTANYSSPVTDENVFELYKVSFAWMSCFVTCSIVIVGLVCSFITGPNNMNSVDPRLLAPITKVVLRKIYGNKYREYKKSWRNSTLSRITSPENGRKRAESTSCRRNSANSENESWTETVI